jgi:hypothetical protein
MTRRFKVGDTLKFKYQDVIIRITDVRPTGYGWEYPHLPPGGGNRFRSENSNDRDFYHWTLVTSEEAKEMKKWNSSLSTAATHTSAVGLRYLPKTLSPRPRKLSAEAFL